MIARASVRVLSVLIAFAMSMPTEAQQVGKVYRIGWLERESAEAASAIVNAFRKGLHDLGYIEGRNLVIEYRSAGGRDDAYPKLAAEVVRLKVDLILARGTPAIQACKQATSSIPILMVGAGDPVGDGLIASFARPGGNVTGFTFLTTDLSAKRLEVLRELLPKASHIAALMNMSNPNLPGQWKMVNAAAQALGIQARLFDVRSPDDLRRAFDEAKMQRVDAVYVGLDTLTQVNRKLIADLAIKHRLPTVTAASDYVDAGSLVAYGPDNPALYRRAANVADKILKGAKPADIPVEQPTLFELAINLKTARALGLSVPKIVLLRADKVIK